MAGAKVIAIRRGRSTGIFESWDVAQPHVKGFSRAEFKGFRTRAEAEAWLGRAQDESRPSCTEQIASATLACATLACSSGIGRKRSRSQEVEDQPQKKHRISGGAFSIPQPICPPPLSGCNLPAMTSLRVCGDSTLVVNQVNGTWRVHQEHLQGLSEESRRLCHALMREHGVYPPGGRGFFLEQFRRVHNKAADVLANTAMDTRTHAQSWMTPISTSASSDYMLTFDGGARGNPGPAGCGAVLSLCSSSGDVGEVVWSGYEFVGECETNNVAEHRGLLLGLRAAAIVAQRRACMPVLSKAESVVHIARGPLSAAEVDQAANGGC
jgi:ribonuclease HI